MLAAIITIGTSVFIMAFKLSAHPITGGLEKVEIW